MKVIHKKLGGPLIMAQRVDCLVQCYTGSKFHTSHNFLGVLNLQNLYCAGWSTRF